MFMFVVGIYLSRSVMFYVPDFERKETSKYIIVWLVICFLFIIVRVPSSVDSSTCLVPRYTTASLYTVILLIGSKTKPVS